LTGQEPVFPAHYKRLHAAFNTFVAQFQSAVFQIAHQLWPLFQQARQRLVQCGVWLSFACDLILPMPTERPEPIFPVPHAWYIILPVSDLQKTLSIGIIWCSNIRLSLPESLFEPPSVMSAKLRRVFATQPPVRYSQGVTLREVFHAEPKDFLMERMESHRPQRTGGAFQSGRYV